MTATKKYPFKFLNAYSQSDRDFFFGREEEIASLYEMVFQTDILLIYGASGTGKTSLIQCGLANKFQPYDWLALSIRRGTDINQALHHSLHDAMGTSPDEVRGDIGEDLDDLFQDFEQETIGETDLSKAFRKVYLNHFRPIYLIFDQFEELYILGDKEEQEKFIATVQEILGLQQPVKIIFSIREEYLGYLYEFEKSIPQLLRRKLRVEPVSLNKVKQIIYGIGSNPNSIVRIAPEDIEPFAEAIFEKIKGEEKTIGIQLPYLQVFLDKIYLSKTDDESRQKEEQFNAEDVRTVGEIGDVLRDFLEERVLQITSDIRQSFPEVKAETLWKVLSLFVTLEGTKEPIDSRHIAQRLPEIEPQVLERIIGSLADNRVLNFSEKEGLYEIAHDSLALQIAAKRTDEEIALLEIRRLIRSQSALKDDAVELFTEKQLNFIEPHVDELSLSAKEKTLITRSRTHVELKKRRKRRRIIGSFAAVLASLLFVSALAVYALQNRQIAESEKAAAVIAQQNAENALRDFLKEKSQREAMEFNSLEVRANTIVDVGGCPEEIIAAMKAIAAENRDSINMNTRIMDLQNFCID